VNDILNSLIEITLSISSVLSVKDNLEDADIMIIEENYQKKKILLDNLLNFQNSEDGKLFILKNLDKWNKDIEKLLKIEKENLEKLDKHVNQLGNRLKEITKQKSLLLYTKE
jgi:hypothetical protein